MIDLNLITEYEQTLIGHRYSVFPTYFCYSDNSNEAMALSVMKYAFETYLRWSPEDIRDYLTMNILKLLKLDGLLKYIHFPIELNPDKDLYYLAWAIYPELNDYSCKDLTLNVYKNLMNKKIEKYPKEFFTGMDGMARACICLKYMIEQNLQFESVEDMYAFFATKEASVMLRKNKLESISKDLYETNVDYIHDALASSQKIEILYHFYKFCMMANEDPELAAFQKELGITIFDKKDRKDKKDRVKKEKT